MSRRRKGHGCGITVLVLLFIFILAGGGLGVLFAKKYMPSNELADKSRIFGIKDGQVALILDNQVQEEKGIYEGGQVYLPVDWVNEHLNQRFYWDEGEKLLVYALPDSIVYADESAQGEKGPLFKVTQDGMYLSLGVVVNYTDIRTQAFATSQIKRVFIDTSWQPYDTAVLKKTGQVRVRGGVKSQIITEAAAGETVDVLETMEKWSRVRTSDGYIGYVENRKLEAGEQVAPVSTFEAPVYTSISMDGKVRLGFHQVTRPEGNNTLESYVSNARGMNVIVPTWFNVVSGDGTYTSLASRDYVDKAHDMGLKVWAMVENVSTEESVKNLNTKTLMSSTSTRKKLIEKLMNEADTYGFDGFNLDFESLKAEAGPHYVQFIREMSVACRNKGLVLSVDNYVPSSYTAFYNRREQGIVADYVIVMGYDEHYAGGEAGSVSSIPYVREGIENTLKEVPKEKVINAIPFYTRVWTVNEGKTSSKAYGISDARQWVEENQVELSWDKLLGQYYGETVSGSGQQYIWMEEEDSMKLKIDLIKEFDLAGVACWKLGFEPADIWDIVSEVK
ncbi:glycosyl hydrolase family 18 protein [Enterocloster clostridioformis]|uniref:Glycoside hydrolase n=1 Tax=[Clostridium] clostridioforme 90A8 TaxID=999408 RepID=A0A0E2HUI8_9FIRM|nr:glycosyl hydrolase family 18 protein [Enterocloster clostridioformis]ENZ19383.1 glycoside hydrolase [[Clostridium] clostridioforme 90A8]